MFTKFNVVAQSTDLTLLDNLSICNNFNRKLFPALKLFPNYSRESQNCANYYSNAIEKNHFDEYCERTNLPSPYLNSYYNLTMNSNRIDSKNSLVTFNAYQAQSEDMATLPTRQQTLDHINGPTIVPTGAGYVSIVPNATTKPNFQKALEERLVFNTAGTSTATMVQDGYTINVPLYALDKCFDISDYWGKGKKI